MPNQPARDNDPFKGVKTGGWSKWGGARQGLIREKTDTWFCQVCGQEQPAELPPYFFQLYPKEYLKICAKCRKKTLDLKITKTQTLIKVTRIVRW